MNNGALHKGALPPSEIIIKFRSPGFHEAWVCAALLTSPIASLARSQLAANCVRARAKRPDFLSLRDLERLGNLCNESFLR